MELEDVKKISVATFPEGVEKIKKEKGNITVQKYLDEIDPSKHPIFDKVKRPDKMKKVGEQQTEVVPVARIAVPLQKLISGRAAAFLCGNPVALNAQPEKGTETDFYSLIRKVWLDNKLDFKNMGLANLMFSETECAELWYTQEATPEDWENTPAAGAKFKLRMRVLSFSRGDRLYPVFDASGDMVAFGRGYNVKVEDKSVEHFDLYTDTSILKGKKSESGWEVKSEANVVGKIPVIYYTQPAPEWADVQGMIERLETVLSNLADTNDYFGSPILFVKGKILGFADKGESGKIIQSEGGAEAEYLSWDRSPESVKMEIENLLKFIFNATDTPNISLEEMSNLGTFSGIALKMLFLGAHLKAAGKEGIFGEGVQRRINYLKAAMAKISVKFAKVKGLEIAPKFEYYLPKNELEAIAVLTDALGGGKAVMSQETAVRLNPLVEDAEAEIGKMRDEGSFGADIETV